MKSLKIKILLLFVILFFQLNFFNLFNEEVLLFFCFFTFLFFFYFYIGDLLETGINSKIINLRVSFFKIFFELKCYIMEKEALNKRYKTFLRFFFLLNFLIKQFIKKKTMRWVGSFNYKNIYENGIVMHLIFIKAIINTYYLLRSLFILNNMLINTIESLQIFGNRNNNVFIMKKKVIRGIILNNKKFFTYYFFNSFIEEDDLK